MTPPSERHPPYVRRCEIPVLHRLLRCPHRSRCGCHSPTPSRRRFPRVVDGRGTTEGNVDSVGFPAEAGAALCPNGIDRGGPPAPTTDRELARALRGDPYHGDVHL